MAETSNIAIMAEKVSKEIFSEFFWENVGPMDTNWTCVKQEKHKKTTHPSDIVFRYEDPYEQKYININFDLKSYAKGSITPTSVRTALESLAMASECTQLSAEWQKNYQSKTMNTDIISALFVYNHDNSFDKDFEQTLYEATKREIPLSMGNKIFVFSPKRIQYLITIVNDIKVLRGDDILPSKSNYTFYYPTLDRKPTRNPWRSSATIEMLFATWQIIQFKTNPENAESNDFGIIVFYSKKGESQEEFQYLIDYLFHYQLISHASKIIVRIANADKYATSNFSSAVDEYKTQFDEDDGIVKKLNSIKCESITNIVKDFSEIEIGME
ncbi:MAG: hypothetical protein P794_03860 [Epsilonproteobacteria bacterium (ex Lamellibrachia satsuma)]|nr:MAG: hypothetical protein P794_03860 [Epsilonproteobacteria bacterium (ex Lamellibrachia satsuma)]